MSTNASPPHYMHVYWKKTEGFRLVYFYCQTKLYIAIDVGFGMNCTKTPGKQKRKKQIEVNNIRATQANYFTSHLDPHPYADPFTNRYICIVFSSHFFFHFCLSMVFTFCIWSKISTTSIYECSTNEWKRKRGSSIYKECERSIHFSWNFVDVYIQSSNNWKLKAISSGNFRFSLSMKTTFFFISVMLLPSPPPLLLFRYDLCISVTNQHFQFDMYGFVDKLGTWNTFFLRKPWIFCWSNIKWFAISLNHSIKFFFFFRIKKKKITAAKMKSEKLFGFWRNFSVDLAARILVYAIFFWTWFSLTMSINLNC